MIRKKLAPKPALLTLDPRVETGFPKRTVQLVPTLPLLAAQAFDQFNTGNDPHREHD